MSQIPEMEALINLLDEPDEKAFSLIREKVFSFGEDAIPLLEKALENTFDELIQGRIEDMIGSIHRDNLYLDFMNWVSLGSEDLLKGFLLVTRTQYPDIEEADILSKVGQLKLDVWLELNHDMTALENIKVLNHFFYTVHSFDGNKANMSAPQNFYINNLLETRKGSPLSLGMLYMILGRKCDLPIYGVNLPQHFILAYLNEQKISKPTEDDVLFYINPFNKGAVFTRREIELFIRQLKIKPERSFFAPCSNNDIIKRLIRHLIFAYNQLGYPDKINDLDHLLSAFE
jgi:regulator of sirC expression with transglutaminase-like and TPR domain